MSGGAAQRLRLTELGIRPGDHAQVLLSGFGRRRLVVFGSQRIALAPEIAGMVTVEAVVEGQGTE
jgi:Fe2+ transport system protein FeoA